MKKQTSFYKLKKGKLRSGTKTSPTIVNKNRKKFLFKRFGIGSKFSKIQAQKLCRQIREYHELLENTGLKISKVITIMPIQKFINGRNTGYFIIGTKEEMIGRGKDVLEQIKTCDAKKAKDLYLQMLKQTGLVTAHKSKPNTPTKILFDSVPKNWVEGPNGKIVYVDFFVPKFLSPKGKLTPFYQSLHTKPREYLQYRYHDKGGIYAVLLTYVAAERPSLRKHFERATIDFLEKQGETKAANKIKELINNNYRVDFINQKIYSKIPGNK